MPGRSRGSAVRLADELVGAVRLDLEDVELRVQRIVRLRREAERAAEDPVLDHDLLDLLQDALAVDLTLAGGAALLDRLEQHLRRAVARRAEGAELLAGVVLLPAGDDRRVGPDP